MFTMDVVVGDTTAGTLYTNEYLDRGHRAIGDSGSALWPDANPGFVQGQVYGSLDSRGVMLGGITVDARGSLIVNNSGSGTAFDTLDPGFYWKGISLGGSGSGSGLKLDNAERGITLLPPGGSLKRCPRSP